MLPSLRSAATPAGLTHLAPGTRDLGRGEGRPSLRRGLRTPPENPYANQCGTRLSLEKCETTALKPRGPFEQAQSWKRIPRRNASSSSMTMKGEPLWFRSSAGSLSSRRAADGFRAKKQKFSLSFFLAFAKKGCWTLSTLPARGFASATQGYGR